jgi:DNA-directed RNA polymerase specialized sigma24 family protein
VIHRPASNDHKRLSVTLVLRSHRFNDGDSTSVERETFAMQLLEDIQQRVDPKHLAAYKLRHGFGYSYGQLSAVFGVTRTSVWRWIDRVETAILIAERSYSLDIP